MTVVHSKFDLISQLKKISITDFTLGFVPTMGALHQGHLSLLEQSVKENNYTVISIFVNPTQFNNPEDLQKYPRNLEIDLTKIATVSKDIIVFAPSVEDMYPNNPSAEKFNFDGLENQMEGQFRPGHFDGVGTIVKRLFEIIQPNRAYFGEKDFQQLQIVKKLVSKYRIPVEVIGCPIYREPNGLAMSSRNERLTETEKEKAAVIFKSLLEAKKMFRKKSARKVIEFVSSYFEKQSVFALEYFQIADEENLLPCKRKSKRKKYRAFIAVFVNNIRLIDTISLN